MNLTDLDSQLSSEYIGAMNQLRSTQEPSQIEVYVESYIDVPFWAELFFQHNDNRFVFKINPISDIKLTSGKNEVLIKHTENAGENLIVCVDSDYDYLLQQTTEFSRMINTSPFIFQTYTYSIENFFCLSESLHLVCVAATNNSEQKIDFVSFIKDYSNKVFPLLVWSVFLMYRGDFVTFTVSEFNTVTSFVDSIDFDDNCSDILSKLELSVKNKLEFLEITFPELIDEVVNFKEYLSEYGVFEDNSYLYVNGHNLFSNMNKVMHPLCCMLIKEKRDLIKQLATSKEEENRELRRYKNTNKALKECLELNKGFYRSDLYSRIKDDIMSYITHLKAS